MPASSSSSSSYAHVASTSCLLEKSPPFSLCQRPLATRTPWPVRASLALHCCPAETLSFRQPQTPSLSPPPVFRNMQTPPRFALSGRIHVLFSTHWHDLRRGIPDFVLPATRSCFCWPFPTRRTAIPRHLCTAEHCGFTPASPALVPGGLNAGRQDMASAPCHAHALLPVCSQEDADDIRHGPKTLQQ